MVSIPTDHYGDCTFRWVSFPCMEKNLQLALWTSYHYQKEEGKGGIFLPDTTRCMLLCQWKKDHHHALVYLCSYVLSGRKETYVPTFPCAWQAASRFNLPPPSYLYLLLYLVDNALNLPREEGLVPLVGSTTLPVHHVITTHTHSLPLVPAHITTTTPPSTCPYSSYLYQGGSPACLVPHYL